MRAKVDEGVIKGYFEKVTKTLGLRMYAEPLIYSPSGEGRAENQGYDAFVPLIDSGISLYVWSEAKLLSVLIYSCKEFDEKVVEEVTKEHFDIAEVETKSF